MNQSAKMQGFTLIELMLYVSIASSVLLLATMTGIALMDVKMKNKAIAEVEQQGTHALFTVLSAMRNSESITFPGVGVSSTTATLNVYAVGDDPTRFDVQNQQLRMARGAGPFVPLTSSAVAVTSFRISNISRPTTAGAARVHLTLRFGHQSSKSIYNYQRTFVGSATLKQP